MADILKHLRIFRSVDYEKTKVLGKLFGWLVVWDDAAERVALGDLDDDNAFLNLQTEVKQALREFIRTGDLAQGTTATAQEILQSFREPGDSICETQSRGKWSYSPVSYP